MSAVKNTIVQTNSDNLEIFSLLWLDAEVNASEENRHAQKRLRSIINHLIIFHDLNECEQYIVACSEHDRLAVIVSGRLSKELLPHV
ncbi:unnamed protein product, partial [Rotaria sp. Silwood2]